MITSIDSSPIQRLGSESRHSVLAHLLALSPADRFMRFGFSAGDRQLENFVERLDFGCSEFYGVWDHAGRLVAMSQIALIQVDDSIQAEFGVSVLSDCRRQGLGDALFLHAQSIARVRGASGLVIYALSQNRPMLNLARRAGAIVSQNGSEAMARIELCGLAIGRSESAGPSLRAIF